MNLIFLVISLYLMTKPLNSLNEESVKQIYGKMYENTKYNSRITVAYTFVFILRRFIFMSIGLFVNNMERGGVQIIALFLINLLFSIYIA